jgi:hypothetical protein
MSTARTARRATAALAAVAFLAGLSPALARGQGGGAAPPTDNGGSPPTPAEPTPPARGSAAFQGTGMWIWQLPRAGSVARIAARARSAAVRTVYVKSGDGVHRWSQFNAGVVSALKGAGLNVCAWQYVYGTKPIAEANVAAVAKRAGADCFVIDAESEYQGRYVAADRYMRRLRALVGASYPIGLAPFPYVDYHPSFPYSVFLGPGRAQYDLPQMYWFSIGTSVDANYVHTYTWHRLYKRPIFPLGESYGRTPTAQIRRFRQLAQAYSATGVSWWEWTQTREAAWQALAVPVVAPTGYQPRLRYPQLGTRSKGDPVVWAQEHLWAAGYQVPIDGGYGSVTRQAVLSFQAARGLPQTGVVDDATWTALLRNTPVSVQWVAAGKRVRAVVARAGRQVVAPAPASAGLPERAREIPPKPHGRG